MSDINDVINMINQTITISRKKYVYFNDDGNIIEINNTFEDKEDLRCLTVDLDQVIEILNGKKSTGNFKVEYNVLEREYQLLEVSSLSKPGLFLYEIPIVSDDTETDLKIVYDKKDTRLFFSLTDDAKRELKQKILYEDKMILFYVTNKGNPDYLIDTVNVQLKDLLWGNTFEVWIGDNTDLSDISILTHNYFSRYSFEVTDE